MDYEWDEAKRLSNLEKHGVDFWSIYLFDWNNAVVEPSPRGGELRWVAIGFIGDRLHSVAFTQREERRRIISLHKANARDRSKYERERRHR